MSQSVNNSVVFHHDYEVHMKQVHAGFNGLSSYLSDIDLYQWGCTCKLLKTRIKGSPLLKQRVQYALQWIFSSYIAFEKVVELPEINTNAKNIVAYNKAIDHIHACAVKAFKAGIDGDTTMRILNYEKLLLDKKTRTKGVVEQFVKVVEIEIKCSPKVARATLEIFRGFPGEWIVLESISWIKKVVPMIAATDIEATSNDLAMLKQISLSDFKETFLEVIAIAALKNPEVAQQKLRTDEALFDIDGQYINFDEDYERYLYFTAFLNIIRGYSEHNLTYAEELAENIGEVQYNFFFKNSTISEIELCYYRCQAHYILAEAYIRQGKTADAPKYLHNITHLLDQNPELYELYVGFILNCVELEMRLNHDSARKTMGKAMECWRGHFPAMTAEVYAKLQEIISALKLEALLVSIRDRDL